MIQWSFNISYSDWSIVSLNICDMFCKDKHRDPCLLFDRSLPLSRLLILFYLWSLQTIYRAAQLWHNDLIKSLVL